MMAKRLPELGKQLANLNQQFEIPSLEEDLGGPPDFELFPNLYHPPMVHQQLDRVAEEYNVRRIKVAGVIVRYVEDMDSIQMTVEGGLPQPTQDALTADLLGKLSKLERAPCELIKLSPSD